MIFTPSLELPSTILQGLLLGKYSLHGGTVRIAKGLPGGGQIVALLKDGMNGLPSAFSAIAPFTALTTAATFGVCAIGFGVLNHKINYISKEIGAISATVQEVATDLERTIIANLETATGLLNKAVRSQGNAQGDYLSRSVDRFMEASSIYRQRFDKTEPENRDQLRCYMQALGVALVGELHCHYIREDWAELKHRASEVAAEFSARARKLLSLSLGCGADYSVWSKDPLTAGYLPKEVQSAAALFLHPRLKAALPFGHLLWLHQRLDSDLDAPALVEQLRPLLPAALSSGYTPTNFGASLKIAALYEDESNLSIWGSFKKGWKEGGSLTETESFPRVANALLGTAVEAALMLDAVESYPEQFKALEASQLTFPKLSDLFSGGDSMEEYLINDEITLAA